MSQMVKKTIEINEDYIERARKIFNVKTYKEAVNKALELAVIDDEIIQAHKAISNKGDFIDEIFE